MRVFVPEREADDAAVGEGEHDDVFAGMAGKRGAGILRESLGKILHAIVLTELELLTRSISPDGQQRRVGLAGHNSKKQGFGGVEADGLNVVSVGTGVQPRTPSTQRAGVDDDGTVIATDSDELHLRVPSNTVDVGDVADDALQTFIIGCQATAHINDLFESGFGYG